MSDTTFVFRLSSYNQSALLTQVSQALEARNVAGVQGPRCACA